MSIRHVSVVSVPVSDPERAKAFYRDTLGFEVRRDNVMGSNMRWIEVAPAGSQASLTLVTWFDAMAPGSMQGLVFNTANIDETVAELNSRGLETGEIKSAPWGRHVTFRDPDGNGLVLMQPAA